MKKVLFFIYSLTFILSCNQGINSYKDGKKDGKWIEYLNEDFTNEVPKDSAKYYRDIFYENGFPKGVVKDYYISGKPQWEGLIISGPYLKDQERPKTKSTGLCIWFDEKTALIRDWSYKDDQGLIDYRRYYFSGYDDIEKDKRFNKGFWLALDKENPLTDNAFKETKKNPMILADIIDELPFKGI